MSQKKKEIILPVITEESIQVFRSQPHRFMVFKISEDATKITHTHISPTNATYGNPYPFLPPP